MIKSLAEIKSIVKKFKNASGVGFAITPQLIKIAIQVGLMGYDEARVIWTNSNVFADQATDDPALLQNSPLLIVWEGLPIRRSNGQIIIGIKRTIEDIETAIKE